MSSIQNGSYTTLHELRFLESIGTFGVTKLTSRELLERYLAAMPLRKDWTGINQKTVESAVRDLLNGRK